MFGTTVTPYLFSTDPTIEITKRGGRTPELREAPTKTANVRTVTLDADIRGAKGELIHAAGTRINPLDSVALRAELIKNRDVTTLSLKAVETYAEATGHQYVKELLASGQAKDWIVGRQLERELGKVFRKVATGVASETTETPIVLDAAALPG